MAMNTASLHPLIRKMLEKKGRKRPPQEQSGPALVPTTRMALIVLADIPTAYELPPEPRRRRCSTTPRQAPMGASFGRARKRS